MSITFLDQNGKVVIEKYTAEIKKENPTVIDVVNALSDAFATLDDYANITISSDGSSVKDVDNYKENLTADENNMIQYWKFLVNGFEPTDDASEATVKDGDTIVYQYVEDTVKAEI